MGRILNLQRLAVATPEINITPTNQDNSSCSDHNCACSTNSAAACFAGDDFVVI